MNGQQYSACLAACKHFLPPSFSHVLHRMLSSQSQHGIPGNIKILLELINRLHLASETCNNIKFTDLKRTERVVINRDKCHRRVLYSTVRDSKWGTILYKMASKLPVSHHFSEVSGSRTTSTAPFQLLCRRWLLQLPPLL